MLRLKISFTLIQIAILTGVLYLGLSNSQYSTNYFVIAYIWIILFTLPSLIAKGLFNKSYFSVTTALSFIYYPVIYLVAFFLTKLLSLDLGYAILAISIFTTLFWNLLLIFITFTKDIKVTKQNFTFAIGIVLLCVGLFSFFTIAGRSQNSIVANDYLVHKTVIHAMSTDNRNLCILPSQCSNLFLLDSYTSFYHTFIIQTIEGYKLDPIVTSYVLDIVFSAFVITIAYQTARKFGLKNNYAIFAALGAFAVFDSGAFTATIFIPQTFAFLLTLIALNSPKLNIKSLFLMLLLLIPIHFIMGIYTFLMLLAYYLIVEKDLLKKLDLKKRFFMFLALITFMLGLVLSITGFSIEKVFQSDEISKLGFATNYYFPTNIKFIFDMLGFGGIIFILCLIYYFIKGRESRFKNFLIVIILAELIVYLLGPIYANKFLIGIGIFVFIFIIDTIAELKFKVYERLFICFYAVLLVAFSFITQYRFFLEFYTQSNGETSAIVQKDLPLVNFLKKSNLNCNFISDPQTQLTISALADKITASGHYMSLDSRRRLFELVKEPTDSKLNALYSLTEFKDHKTLCFVYSARLKQYVVNNNQDWTFNIYNYIVDYNKEIDSSDNIEKFLTTRNIKYIYSDTFYKVYLLPNTSK